MFVSSLSRLGRSKSIILAGQQKQNVLHFCIDRLIERFQVLRRQAAQLILPCRVRYFYPQDSTAKSKHPGPFCHPGSADERPRQSRRFVFRSPTQYFSKDLLQTGARWLKRRFPCVWHVKSNSSTRP